MQPSPTPRDTGSDSKPRSLIRILTRHPRRTAQAVVLTLLAIIIVQNLESTSVDVLFWTVSRMPKLLLILVSMLIGAGSWEILRRLLGRVDS